MSTPTSEHIVRKLNETNALLLRIVEVLERKDRRDKVADQREIAEALKQKAIEDAPPPPLPAPGKTQPPGRSPNPPLPPPEPLEEVWRGDGKRKENYLKHLVWLGF